MNTVQILKEARGLIANEANWTKHYYSADKEGQWVMPRAPAAVCFCSVGALHRVLDLPMYLSIPESIGKFFFADEKVQANFDGSIEGAIVDFNDQSSHSEVLALFDRAIARAESEAA